MIYHTVTALPLYLCRCWVLFNFVYIHLFCAIKKMYTYIYIYANVMATHRMFFVIQNCNQMIYSAILCFSFRLVSCFFFQFWSLITEYINLYVWQAQKTNLLPKCSFKSYLTWRFRDSEESCLWKLDFGFFLKPSIINRVRFNAYSHVKISKAKNAWRVAKKKLFSNPFVEFWVGLECLHMC